MRKTLVTIAVLISTLAASPANATIPDGEAKSEFRWHFCKAEDGSGQPRCIWDARHEGNGYGRSVKIVHGGTERARLTFITHREARQLLGRDRHFKVTQFQFGGTK